MNKNKKSNNTNTNTTNISSGSKIDNKRNKSITKNLKKKSLVDQINEYRNTFETFNLTGIPLESQKLMDYLNQLQPPETMKFLDNDEEFQAEFKATQAIAKDKIDLLEQLEYPTREVSNILYQLK